MADFPKIKPLFSKVLIRKKEAEKQSKGGILLPDRAQKSIPMGEILAIGPGKKDNSMAVEVGQVVLFNDYGYTKVPEHDDLVMIDQEQILGVVEK